jgi:hypothetical protein
MERIAPAKFSFCRDEQFSQRKPVFAPAPRGLLQRNCSAENPPERNPELKRTQKERIYMKTYLESNIILK